MAERLLTINMRRYLQNVPRTKRFRKASRYVRERVAHYTKTELANVKIAKELNNDIMGHYAKSMEPLKLRVSIDNSVATVTMFGAEKKEDKAAPAKEAKPKAAAPSKTEGAKPAGKPKPKAAPKDVAKPEAK